MAKGEGGRRSGRWQANKNTTTTKSYNGRKRGKRRRAKGRSRACWRALHVVVARVAAPRCLFSPLTVAPFDVTSASPNTLRKEHNQQQQNCFESIKQKQKKIQTQKFCFCLTYFTLVSLSLFLSLSLDLSLIVYICVRVCVCVS